MDGNTSSTKQVSFDEAASSATSDEDRNPVEVVFDESNPYRRKSSLVATDSVPPHLRRTPPPPHRKTECLVHQFLANQRRPKQHHLLPHHRHHPDHAGHPVDADLGVTRVHHRHAGTATCEAHDNSSEARLDRPLDPKGGDNPPARYDGCFDEGKRWGGENPAVNRPYATILPDPPRAAAITTTTSDNDNDNDNDDDDDDDDDDQDDDGDYPHQTPHAHAYAHYDTNNASGASSTNGGGGQQDEKHWRHAMVLPRRTPSQLDRRSASADAPNSRLLTKKQLSEMAWGVRELSRRLGSMRLRFRVKTIFVLTKIYDPDLIANTRALCRWLLDRERDVRYTLYVDHELKENKRFDAPGLVEEVRRDFVESGELSEEAGADVGKRLRFWDEDMCRARPHTFDFVITLGGDGTVLYASWLFQRIVPPVLSFALGSLGFLTKFDWKQYQQTLTKAFDEGVTVSLRLRFEATVMRSQKTGARLKEKGGEDDDGGGGKPAEVEKEGVVNGDSQRPPRDLVEELIGEEKDDEHTHRPDGTYEVLNEVVVDRGPNPSESHTSFSSYGLWLISPPL